MIDQGEKEKHPEVTFTSKKKAVYEIVASNSWSILSPLGT